MNAETIAAVVVFGPSILLGGALGVGILTGQSRRRYLRGALAVCREMNAADHHQPTPPQPEGGEAAPEQLADVIPFRVRRAA
ncbi:hypothetical protein [Streptacidiphilus fuscans]|uniref:Uncharacterized protein n=1 Tax=Streptacidiphilus fuscans TaxID=2789292 RepID=A0A931FC73_9ACTN|nr:hypothetical protein [Streptacidiphilus fuscans]MBF9068178.1 hypothetical protein [Streptacidiphilus fuscans]